MPESCYIEIDGSRVHYLLTGGGTDVAIAFHGYGLDAGSLQLLADSMAPGYKFLSVDLPYHGRTEWGGGPLNKHKLVALAKALAARHGTARFTLVGYSLGGRVCMTLAELVPELVEQMVLIAPDGLVFNFAYYLATHNIAGKRLFHYILRKPSGFFKLADWLVKRKVISNSKHKFVTQYLESRAAREMLGKVWRDTSDLIPEHRKLKQNLTAYRIPVNIFMGSFDSVIPVEHADKFAAGLPTVKLTLLQKGHKILDAQTAAQIAGQILRK